MLAKWEILILFNMSLLSASYAAMEPKIYGGQYSSMYNFPYSVHMSLACIKDHMVLCGASILNQRVLVTAGHCLDDCVHYDDWEGQVYAGHADLNKVTIIRKISRFLIHKYFNERNLIHDIALAYLNDDLPLGQMIKRVMIPEYFPAGFGYITGWGVSGEHQDGTIKMKSIGQYIQNSQVCEQIGQLQPGMMCAESGDEHQYPAQGDSGSGLVTNDDELFGLVSFTSINFPYITVYTNVTYYNKWIAREARRLACY